MKALVINDVVVSLEYRDIDVHDYYHKDIANLFVDCPSDTKKGDKYVNGKFVKVEDMEG